MLVIIAVAATTARSIEMRSIYEARLTDDEVAERLRLLDGADAAQQPRSMRISEAGEDSSYRIRADRLGTGAGAPSPPSRDEASFRTPYGGSGLGQGARR